MASSPQLRTGISRWLGAVLAIVAAFAVLAGPAAAPPHPRLNHVDMPDIRPAAAVAARHLAQPAFMELEIDQQFSSQELTIGGRTSVEITVANYSDAVASGVVVRSTLGATLIHEISSPPASIEGTDAVWRLGTMAVDDEIVITMTVRATRAGTVLHRVSALSDATEEVASLETLAVTGTGLTPGVTAAPASPPAGNELAATGATLNWLLAASLVMVAGGALALEASSRVPAMAGLRGPQRRRRANRPVFHPVRAPSRD